MKTLGVLNWKPQNKIYSVRKLSDTIKAERLDAEYYQTKYDELIETLYKHAVSLVQISEMQTYNARGTQPSYYENGEISVINSQHILEDGLDYDNFERTSLREWEEHNNAQVKTGDILVYTTGANIGRTAIYLKEEKAIASNHVNLIRIKEKNKIYVSFVLNSLIGRLQVEKLCTGSAQQELYPKDIEKIYIPFITEKTQNEISDKIMEYNMLKQGSEKMTCNAKIAVEMAIEQNETKAMKWLDEQA